MHDHSLPSDRISTVRPVVDYPHLHDLVHATTDVRRAPTSTGPQVTILQRGSVRESASSSRFASHERLRTMKANLRRVIGVGESRARSVTMIRVLEDDIVAQNYRYLEPIEVVERGTNLIYRQRPSETHPIAVLIGLSLLFMALGIASSPLFLRSIDAESLTDNSGLLVPKNVSYAKAYFLGNGFYANLIKKMNANVTAMNWFPQPTETTFLNSSYLLPSAYATYGTGACALLNTDPMNPLECIVMTGHQGTVNAYGLCRNGSEFVSLHYITGLVTPVDVGGLISAGTWIDNMREVLFTGLKKPPTCVDRTKIVVIPKLDDWRLLSGPFVASTRGVTYQWLDTMGLPTSIRARMFYLIGKSGGRLGLTLPLTKRYSFDQIIAQNTYDATLADMLEIETPFVDSKYAYCTVYTISAAKITLPRLQFTFAVAAQSLSLLMFLLVLTFVNGPLRSYHFVVQILRLPTFCIISIQMLYVLYYQLFSISYLATNPLLHYIFIKKIVYAAGISFVLMHQMDVRAAVTLWPRMANNDSYYVARLVWMLSALGGLLWSLNQNQKEHYTVRPSRDCAFGAFECNTSKTFFPQHWVCLGIFAGHPLAYGIIQIAQWYRHQSEYIPHDQRLPRSLTSFEAYGCGGPLTKYYYYHTLVTQEFEKQPNGTSRTLQYLTCAKAVRDEGFVMLSGCNALVRAKDVHIIVVMKLMPRFVAAHVNLSVVIAHVVDHRLTPLRRVSYEPLWTIARRWDGGISYPDIA